MRRIENGESADSSAVRYPMPGDPCLLNVIFAGDTNGFIIVDIVVAMSKNCNEHDSYPIFLSHPAVQNDKKRDKFCSCQNGSAWDVYSRGQREGI